MGGGFGTGFSDDLNDGIAIGCDDLGDHVPSAGGGWLAVGSDRKLAAAAKGVKGDAFGFDTEAGVWVFEEGDGVADVCVAVFVGLQGGGVAGRAGFETEGTLSGRGAEFFRRKAIVDRFRALEAIEAGGGEDECVAFAVVELLEAGVDVAADLDEVDIGAEGEELRAATRAGGADGSAHRQGVEGPVRLADPDVAGVDAFRDGGESELRSELGGEVLEGVDGEVDTAFFEGFFDLLDEDALAVEVGRRDEAGLLHAVACGADDLKLNVVAGVAEGIQDVVGLPEGELRAARADADGIAGIVHTHTEYGSVRLVFWSAGFGGDWL